MNDENVLEFVIFCIENTASQLKIPAEKLYKIMEQNNVLNDYIIPEYGVLHTQGKNYIVDDIINYMKAKGIIR